MYRLAAARWILLATLLLAVLALPAHAQPTAAATAEALTPTSAATPTPPNAEIAVGESASRLQQLWERFGWWTIAILVLRLGGLAPTNGSRFLVTNCQCLEFLEALE